MIMVGLTVDSAGTTKRRAYTLLETLESRVGCQETPATCAQRFLESACEALHRHVETADGVFFMQMQADTFAGTA
ncbi:MAG: hypothetical protein CSB46_05915, partial [Micrococcales bacterium]